MGLWKFIGKCIVLATVVSLLYGCPYDSEVPLGQIQSAQIDKTLVGNWLFKSNDQKESGVVTISPFNEKELLIVVREEGKSPHDFYRAFVSIVDGEKFLSIQEVRPKNEKRSWVFVNYSMANGELNFRIVEDKLFREKFASSSALQDFIRANIKNRDLYAGDGGPVLKFAPEVPSKPAGK
jgi:hypothetical protein